MTPSLLSITDHGGFISRIEQREIPGAGRALFLTDDIAPRTCIVRIPKESLLNADTIAFRYPKGLVTQSSKGIHSGALNSTQSLSMHLFMERRSPSDHYIASLPMSFDEHPLTWHCLDPDPHVQLLLEFLPPSSKTCIDRVVKRFQGDWEAVQMALTSFGIEFPSDKKGLHDFIWAWLCVNTRCIHYSLLPSSPTRSIKDVDLTLSPIIDLANHTIDDEHTARVDRLPDGALILESPNFPMRKGDEVLFHYNSHSNSVLFSEYGFVIPRVHSTSAGGEVCVDDIVEDLFKGDQHKWRRELLEDSGYWGDWTLYATPIPAHPSFRLLPPLRLLHIEEPAEKDKMSPHGLERWEATVLGHAEIVDAENESASRQSLRKICQDLINRSDNHIRRLNKKWHDLELSSPETQQPWSKQARQSLEILWTEESEVAQALIDGIDNGAEFS